MSSMRASGSRRRPSQTCCDGLPAHWPGPAPAYLTLIGDGHWNMKGLNPALYGAAPDYIPPYLAFVDLWLGEVPVDMRYGDLDGDGLPEVAVGRLTANSLAEANVVVDKIVNYDETFRAADWQRAPCLWRITPTGLATFRNSLTKSSPTTCPRILTVTQAYLPGSSATPQQTWQPKKSFQIRCSPVCGWFSTPDMAHQLLGRGIAPAGARCQGCKTVIGCPFHDLQLSGRLLRLSDMPTQSIAS